MLSAIIPEVVPDEELCDHYNLCYVFALPSRGEGFGIVYLEALACGKPILAGNQDGAVDPLVHGKLGCLVNPLDVDAIANNLILILQGTYPNPLMFQPELLRQETIKRFEVAHFCQILTQLTKTPSERGTQLEIPAT
ncbi:MULTISPECIES: glycosyltransferase [unclassified Coleofasciculus]|uniref:glycosyltransferase n=1 Tax=unclassified Coleofasciculus TaxID=2692782 RepID=UPI001D1597D4|nr:MULTISPECIES: glycosyltransferase [unclassified Coleofasciculus]